MSAPVAPEPIVSLEVEDLPGNGRYLGEGPHSIAAGQTGFIVTFVDLEEEPTVRVALFRSDGDRLGVHSLGDQSSFVSIAHPVVAALPDGTFAVAWAGFHETDDDELAILLQRVDLETGPIGAPRAANVTMVGAQHSPDILWAGNELVVAWTDESAIETSPDLRFRTFSSSLSPISNEQTLAGGTEVEGGVSLAPFAGTWAATWRAGQLNGLERIVVSTVEGTFSSQAIAPGAIGDRPSLAELDDTHLLVAFTVGAETDDSGIFNTSRLQYGIVDVEGAPTFTSAALPPLREPYASNDSLSQTEPTLVRAGDSVYVSWRSESVPTPLQEEVWLKSMVWNTASGTLNVSKPEGILQVSNLNRRGDQRSPKLAASPVFPSGTVIAGWVDYGQNLPGAAGPDIVAELRGVTTDPCFQYEQQATPPFSMGMHLTPDGTIQRPYTICTVEQLEHAMITTSLQSKYFVLAADLDLAELEGAFGSSTPFTGTFDGNGHVLVNYQNLQPSGDEVGFIEQLSGDGSLDGLNDGELKNLTLLDAVVEGDSYVGVAIGRTLNRANIRNVHVRGGSVSGHDLVGGIAGQVLGKISESSASATVSGAGSSPNSAGAITGRVESNSSVERVFTTGSVSGFDSDAGGLVGVNNGTILRSSATGEVTSPLRAGGLVGRNAGAVTDSFTLGPVTGGDRAGGLVGQNDSTATVTRAYAVGNVTATTNGGALVGYQNSSPTYSATFRNSTLQASLPTVGNLGSAPSGIVAKTDGELKQRSTYLAQSWDFVSVWAIEDGDDYAIHLTPQYDFCAELTQQTTPPFVTGLGADGTAGKPYPLCNVEQIQHLANTSALWTKHFRLMTDVDLSVLSGAIAATSSFSGTFDGNGHRLLNYARASTGSNTALFGAVSGVVRNLTLESFAIEGASYTGTLAGRLSSASARLEDVHVLGSSVHVNSSTAQFVGGLVGEVLGTITGCTFSGAVTSNATGSGGLIGIINSSGKVYASGTSGSLQALNNGGGVVGNITSGILEDSSSSMNVQASGIYAGGLVGQMNAGIVARASASGAVSGSSSAGGLVGHATNGAQILDSISTGATSIGSGGTATGGLLGGTGTTGTPILVHHCRATGAVSGGSHAGGLVGDGVLVTIQLSAATGSVSGGGRVGGLVGSLGSGSLIADSLAQGDVSVSSGTGGGLVGQTVSVPSMQRTCATGGVSGPGVKGGYIGTSGATINAASSFWNTTVNSGLSAVGSGTANGVSGRTTTQLQQQSTYTGWNFITIWKIDEGQSYAELR